MLHELKAALHRHLADLTFDDNRYLDDAFIASSIQNNFAGWYDPALLPRQIDLILQSCPMQPGATVLDAACGHGKHSELLFQKGFAVVGTDISKPLIAYLTERHQGQPSFKLQALQDLEDADAYDLVLVLGNSLSLFPKENLPAVLRRLQISLTDHGWLFVELENRADYLLNYAGTRKWTCHADRWIVLSQYHYDECQCLEKSLDVGIDLESGSVDQFPLTKSLYDQSELADLFSEARLSIRRQFGDWQGNSIAESSPSMLVAAQRAS